MAILLQTSLVRYSCRCAAYRPLCELHFCRYCGELRCEDCVNWELDSAFCALCLEGMPTVNAQEHRNCCRSCVLCPVCQCKLSVRRDASMGGTPTSAGGDSPAHAAVPQFYVQCATCNWSSRGHEGLPLQSSVHGPWVPPPNDQREQMFEQSLGHFKTLGNNEKLEKTERLADRHFGVRQKRASHLFYSEKYGLAQLYARKGLMGLNQPDTAGLLDEVAPTGVVPQLDEAVLRGEWPEQSPTLSMRLQQPSFDCGSLSALVPVRQRQQLRPCLRCRQCGHRVLRLVYSPASIEFKIQAFAINHVPELRLNRPVVLRTGQACDVELVVCNLMRSPTTTALVAVDGGEDNDITDDKDTVVPVVVGGGHKCELQLSVLGDEELTASLMQQDDPSVVIYRDGHKVCVRAAVTPNPEHKGKMLWARINITYTYNDMLADVVEEAGKPRQLTQRVKVKLGTLPN